MSHLDTRSYLVIFHPSVLPFTSYPVYSAVLHILIVYQFSAYASLQLAQGPILIILQKNNKALIMMLKGPSQ